MKNILSIFLSFLYPVIWPENIVPMLKIQVGFFEEFLWRLKKIWPEFLGTPHCWGHLVFVQPLPTIHTSYPSLENLHWFDAIFKILTCAVFEAIEVNLLFKVDKKVVDFSFTQQKIFWVLVFSIHIKYFAYPTDRSFNQ